VCGCDKGVKDERRNTMEERIKRKIKKLVHKLITIYESRGQMGACRNLAYICILLDNLDSANVVAMSEKDDLTSFEEWSKYGNTEG
jgi:hypothetical protein